MMDKNTRSRSVQFCPVCGRQLVRTLSDNYVCGWCDYQDDFYFSIEQENGAVDWRENVGEVKGSNVLEQLGEENI